MMTSSQEVLMMGAVPVDSQPETIGRGWWGATHAFAYVCDTSSIANSREMFIDIIVRGIGSHFPCLDCRSHAVEYMTRIDPIRDLLKMPKTGPDGMTPLMICLAWSYRFHEAVNERLKKPKSLRPSFSHLEKFLADLREGKGCNHCGPIGSLKPQATAIPQMRRQILD